MPRCRVNVSVGLGFWLTIKFFLSKIRGIETVRTPFLLKIRPKIAFFTKKHYFWIGCPRSRRSMHTGQMTKIEKIHLDKSIALINFSQSDFSKIPHFWLPDWIKCTRNRYYSTSGRVFCTFHILHFSSSILKVKLVA